ncbi:Cytoplasmic 60S subunit biogenesis factor REI1 [Teratosphaeria destructans]|uniref:Cytoplasmic 60S subunit biogenesis factor REI1 n=1 Tax=Teratosphaeria destructans TaxID=418781 RepID=A0A9W7W471_9PEZI|nr:Cytoplasmic 60S subunit biogenesis factor REI1 [Teratosphaeria destructans]
MQGFNMGRAPNFSNKTGKRPPGTLRDGKQTVRFEVPYAVWCHGCKPHAIIAQGVRFNAEKKKVGYYYSTPIWSFRMRHPACGQFIEIRTDPKNTAYVVHEGGKARDYGEDKVKEGEDGIPILTAAEREARRQDAFAELEGKADEKTQAKENTKRIEELYQSRERDWDDPWIANKRMRTTFRHERKMRKREEEATEALKERLGTDMELLPETEQDAQRAKLVTFGDLSLETAESKALFERRQLSKASSAGRKPVKASAKDMLQRQLASNTLWKLAMSPLEVRYYPHYKSTMPTFSYVRRGSEYWERYDFHHHRRPSISYVTLSSSPSAQLHLYPSWIPGSQQLMPSSTGATCGSDSRHGLGIWEHVRHSQFFEVDKLYRGLHDLLELKRQKKKTLKHVLESRYHRLQRGERKQFRHMIRDIEAEIEGLQDALRERRKMAIAYFFATESPCSTIMATTSTHPFTCNTCQVAFRSSDLQRTHMQSDWHRYNLKRRVASLPPLTSEIFAEKVLANKASAAATAARASFEKRCEACEKTYYSENAFTNHLGSQKHKILAARLAARGGHETESMADSTFSLGDPVDTASTTASTVTAQPDEGDDDDGIAEVVHRIKKTELEDGATSTAAAEPPQENGTADEHMEDEDYEHKADVKQCLFCNYVSPTLDLNLHHMSKQHGFFVPEKEFLVDLAGLINYLSETIEVLHTCLFCHKHMHTATGVQTHMRDRGHCMVAYSTEEEQLDIGDFYDFSSTYSDDEEHGEAEESKGGVSLGVKRDVKTTIEGEDGEDVDMDEDEDGWESDSTLSSVPTDEITSVPIEHQDHKYEKLHLHRHHSHKDPRPHKDSDGFHSHAHHTPRAVYHDDYELHLPSGRTAGHRSLRAYYRQNLRNYPTPEERAQQRMIAAGRHVSDDEDDNASETTETNGERGRGRQVITRANGGSGMIGVSDMKKREVRIQEKRDQKRAQRQQNRYQAGNEKRGNFQKHFRDHLLQ